MVNLSHPEKWVETFGMTLLEGMEYGIPVISPTVGGCTELVQHGVNGFQLDQRETATIIEHINRLFVDPILYQKLSKNAKVKAKEFNVAKMWKEILYLVD